MQKPSLQKQVDILARAIEQWEDQDSAVEHALTAPELEKVIDVSLADAASSEQAVEQAVLDYLKYSPKSAHPEYYKLLYSGLNKEALLGDWVTSLSNSTMHTFQVGPVATLMELELIKQWNKLVGFDQGDGVMVSGGSQANIVGMMLARHKACPEFKTKGFAASHGRRLIAYVSDQAHYSNQRAVNILGIGSENLRSIESDELGRIKPEELSKAIKLDLEKGHLPFYIGLTAGTTVVGAYDSVPECSEIAHKHNIWLHIDGAWGAPVLYSDKFKHLLAGSHLADSFAWDAHKLLNVPITAAVILVKQAGILKECTAGGGGEYLFHTDANSAYNLGERSIQCGRRADALKVWLSWKAVGSSGFAQKVDQLQETKAQCVEMIQSRPALEILAPTDYLNILFRFNDKTRSEEALAALNVQICKTMRENGGAYVDHAKYKGHTGIRLIIANQQTQVRDLERLLLEVERIGKELSAKLGKSKASVV